MAENLVYFIRHGIAAERGTYPRDADRPLVPHGIERTHRVAQRLKSLNIHCALALTSPLVRAQQTAAILQTVGVAEHIEVFEPLSPEGNIQLWLSWLSHWQQQTTMGHALAVVGHQPDLTLWAQQLIGAAGSHWQLKKAGIIGLQVPAADEALGRSLLFWLTPPRLLL